MPEYKLCTFVLDGGVYEVYQTELPTPEEFSRFARVLSHTLGFNDNKAVLFPDKYRVMRVDIRPADAPQTVGVPLIKPEEAY